jgi:hypothetical protein
MFDFPVKQRKVTTYGRKTSRPGVYSIARDEHSPERSKQTRPLGWKSGTPSTSIERPQATTIGGKLTRPSPKKPKDTLWDGPSDDDERGGTLDDPSNPPVKVVGGASKHSRAKSVPQHETRVKEVQNVGGTDKKRKRDMTTRATSQGPKEVGNSEVSVLEEKVLRKAQSIEPSRPHPVSAKKKEVRDIYDLPTDDEQPLGQKKPRSIFRKKKEIETCDVTMEEEPVMAAQRRVVKPKEASHTTRQRAKTPSLNKKKEKDDVDLTVKDGQLNVAKASRLAHSKSKETDIFDFPSDEEPVVMKKPKASRLKEGSQPPPRKRVRTPAADTNESIQTRKRGQTKTPEPPRTYTATRRTTNKATSQEPSGQSTLMQTLNSPKALPKSSKTLPGVGWHPRLAIHSSPNRRLQQGSSAPAALFSMIREQPQSPPTDSSDNVTRPVTPRLDSDEMDVDTTPATPPMADFGSPSTLRAAVSSQTPRQKQLWGQLLASELGESPSDLPISRLNLKSTRKAPSIARASSDIPQTTYSRRSRLIDSLKASAPIVEEEDDDDDDGDDTSMDSSTELSEPGVARPSILVQPEAVIRTTSTKVTYAQQRTFLQEQNEEAMYDILAEELNQQTSGYGSQNQNNLLGESDTEDSQEAHPRGVHDLRAAGSKRRLLDELDHLVEDVQGMAVATVSARRSALMELAQKLMDPDAATIFLDSGMDLRLIKSVEDLTDITFIFLAATTIVLLTDAGATLNTLERIHKSKVFARIVGLLSLKQDLSKVVKERKSNMSRVAQSSVVEFKDTILKSRLFADGTSTSLSPRMMALRCLDSVIRKVRDQGSRTNILDQEDIGKLLRVAQSSNTSDATEVAVFELSISILEAHTLSRSAGWTLELVDIFVQILPPIFGSFESTLQHSKFLALRLSLNLTNENAAASEFFALPSLTTSLMQSINHQYALLRVKVAPEDHAVNVANTLLALGVMLNLAEFSDQVRTSVLDGGSELLTNAVTLFLESKEHVDQAESVEETQTNVAFGYLAFMLGSLCQNEKVRGRVCRQLPDEKLALLLEEMQKFVKMHQRADKMNLEGVEGEELERGHAQRLQTIVDTLTALDY